MSGPVSVSTRATSNTASATILPPANDHFRNQALRAALASQRPPIPPPKRLTRNGFVSSGALAAATRAGMGQGRSEGGSNINRPKDAAVVNATVLSSAMRTPSPQHTRNSKSPQHPATSVSATPMPYLAAPDEQSNGARQPSPSHIAAVRAAARSATPGTAVQKKESSPVRQNRSPERKDEAPIPPTNKLVQLFEAKSSAGLEAGSRPVTVRGPSVVLSPKPVRSVSMRLAPRRSQDHPDRTEAGAVPDVAGGQNPEAATARTTYVPTASYIKSVPHPQTPKSSTAAGLAVPLRASSRRDSAPERPRELSAQQRRLSTIRSMSASPPSSPPVALSPNPQLLPPRLPLPRQQSITTQISVPDDGLRAASLARRSGHTSEHIKPHLTADSLANAMVAGSLASSRAPSPYKAPPPQPPQPPPPRRGAKGLSVHSLFPHSTGNQNQSQGSAQRQPSPNKPHLRSTLRANAPDSEATSQAAATKGGKLRKNGRGMEFDSISHADRKLYEGVWAANRGILIPLEESADGIGGGVGSTSIAAPSNSSSTSLGKVTSAATSTVSIPGFGTSGNSSRPSRAADEVHGYVVRDIWTRSGLDRTVLEHIWELVDGGENGKKRSGVGRLDRQEFVVGMWLVDQALAGRKLPSKKVPEQVWASLRIGSGFEFRR